MKNTALKLMVSGLVFLFMLFIELSNNVYGQKCPKTLTDSTTYSGCDSAKTAQKVTNHISFHSATKCNQRTCTSGSCYLSSLIVLQELNCTKVADATCPHGFRWTCKEKYQLDCQCHGPRMEGDLTQPSITSGDLRIFPNPASEEVSIDMSDYYGNIQLHVVNMLGQHVFDIAGELNGDEFYYLDVSSFPKGLYKVILLSGLEMKTGTIIKE